MNEPLAYLFRHHHWANLRLLDACAALPSEQLDASAVGGYGSIRDTLAHIARAEAGYARAFTGEEAATDVFGAAAPGLADVREQLDASGRAFVAIAEGMDADRLLDVRYRGQEQRMPASFFVLQAINHATEHRTQVATILTQLGIEPPAVSGWAFAAEG